MISAGFIVVGGVDAVARQLAEVTDRVDVLINNVGVMRPAREVTAEG